MQVRVLAPDFPGGRVALPGVDVDTFPLIGLKFGDFQFARPDLGVLDAAVMESDVVFNQSMGLVGLASLALARRRRKPFVSFIHSIDWDLVGHALRCGSLARLGTKWLARVFYNRCSLLCYPSAQVATLLRDNGIRTPMEPLEIGVDAALFLPPLSKEEAKKCLGLSPDDFVVGYCGRLAREKNLPLLAAAFSRFKKLRPRSRLLIVGEGLHSELPAVEGLFHAGLKTNVVPYLQAMDVFVLASATETASLSTMEAMSCGLPVVVTPLGLDFIRDGENALVFPFGNAVALAGKLEILANAPLRARLGASARETILRRRRSEDALGRLASLLGRFAPEKATPSRARAA